MFEIYNNMNVLADNITSNPLLLALVKVNIFVKSGYCNVVAFF